MASTARRPRGYLLIEITIGGALVAILIAGLLTQIADARAKNVIAGRDVIAAQLVQQKIEIERARGFVAAADCAPAETAALISGQQGAYRRTCTRAAGAAQTIGTTALSFNDVVVRVEFDTTAGTRSVEARTRVYDR